MVNHCAEPADGESGGRRCTVVDGNSLRVVSGFLSSESDGVTWSVETGLEKGRTSISGGGKWKLKLLKCYYQKDKDDREPDLARV